MFRPAMALAVLTVAALVPCGYSLVQHTKRDSSFDSMASDSQIDSSGLDPWKLINISFRRATLAVNNLGGMGPQFDKPQEIRYAHAFAYMGRQVDIVFEANSPYQGNAAENGKNGSYAQIHLHPGTNVSLKVSFQDTITGKPVRVQRFRLAVLDLDTGISMLGLQEGHKSFAAGPLLSYSLTNTSHLTMPPIPKRVKYFVFNATHYGDQNADPVSGQRLTQEHKDQAVILEFASLHKFRLQLAASAGSVGRKFLLGGVSIYMQEEFERTHVGPCSDFNELDFTLSSVTGTNLVGEGMRFSNVFPSSDEPVDLVVKADSNYVANDESANGLNGSCGIVNFAANSSAQLTFSFVHSGTDVVFPRRKFFFTLLDIDSPSEGFEKVEVNRSDWSMAWLSANTSIQVMYGDKSTYRSTAYGTSHNNPSHPLQLSREAMSNSVSLFKEEATGQFRLKFIAKGGNIGRNMLFSGRSSYVCPNLS